MKICVVTSVAAAAEPRGPRHAVACKRAFPRAEVTFVDMAPRSAGRLEDPPILGEADIRRHTIAYPTKTADPLTLVARRAAVMSGRIGFRIGRRLSPWIFGERVVGLAAALRHSPQDAYLAHNIETLLPAALAAKAHGAALMFDCMEYYSSMGDGQSGMLASASAALERRLLGRCTLVLASSEALAEALEKDYAIARPFASYNVPPLTLDLPDRRGGGLNLYWRNSVIGLGQRGLEEAIRALQLLPPDVRLFLQGRPGADGGEAIARLVSSLGVRERVTVLPPYAPQDAVAQAAPFDIGLCLERRGPRNHELTVSNKLFDYHMAGLAVIASNQQGLRQVLERSGAGLLFEPGSPEALAKAVMQLHDAPRRLAEMQAKARRFALASGNLDIEMASITAALQRALPWAAPPEGRGEA